MQMPADERLDAGPLDGCENRRKIGDDPAIGCDVALFGFDPSIRSSDTPLWETASANPRRSSTCMAFGGTQIPAPTLAVTGAFLFVWPA